MSGPAFLQQPSIRHLPELLRDIWTGVLKVPRFQRGFQWTHKRRLDLMDSIYQGIPIGSMTVWRTSTMVASKDKLGAHHLPEQAVPPFTDYLIDGQQRITTLFAALGAALAPDGVEVSLSEDPKWSIYFDLETLDFHRPHRRMAASESLVPLSVLLDTYSFNSFTREKLVNAPRRLMKRLDHLVSVFRNYAIPIIPIVTNDLQQATLSFKRLNSGGLKMDEVHMVRALTWRPDFDLTERFNDIRAQLEDHGWKGLSHQEILNSIKTQFDVSIHQTSEEKLSNALRDAPETLDSASRGLLAATRFLSHECGIYGPVLLPSKNQLVVLTEFFVLLGDTPMTLLMSSVLRRWFWQTTYARTFTGLSEGGFNQIRQQLALFARSGSLAPSTPHVVEETRWMSVSTSSRAAALSLLLAECAPRRPSGELIGKPDRLLGQLGQKALCTGLSPGDMPGRDLHRLGPMVPENRFIVVPGDVGDLRRALKAPEDQDEAFFRSHAINEAGVTALRAGDFVRFLEVRRQTLQELERERVEAIGFTYQLADTDDDRQE
ncbi:MAG: hypothetical protein ACI8S6_001056 [Myxococcota bacterium]|jgi:hypothetical protein